MTSVAMMISNLMYHIFNQNITDIVLWIINTILWFVALLLIGKKFAMSTLIGTICYSAFMTLFLRLDLVTKWGLLAYYQEGDVYSKTNSFWISWRRN